MALDFTNIPDREGVAIYCLHDGTVTQEQTLKRLIDTLATNIPHQIVLLSANDTDGEKIREFYDLDTANFPHVILVDDDDQIVASWSGGEIPSADVIAYTARSISEG